MAPGLWPLRVDEVFQVAGVVHLVAFSALVVGAALVPAPAVPEFEFALALVLLEPAERVAVFAFGFVVVALALAIASLGGRAAGVLGLADAVRFAGGLAAAGLAQSGCAASVADPVLAVR